MPPTPGLYRRERSRWYQGSWAVRAVCLISRRANSEVLEPDFTSIRCSGGTGAALSTGELPGKALVTVFDSHGRMALLDDAIVRAQVTGENIITR